VIFENRSDAGRRLAAELAEYARQPVIVLAIPNGGVPLAIEVATALHAELGIIVCRKLALPMNPEGGLGAVADDGTMILNEDVIARDGISREQIEHAANQIKSNVKQRSLRYKGEAAQARLTGKTAIRVDDGLASGITMTVAVEAVRHRSPREIVAAVPLASATGYSRAAGVANRVIACAIGTMPKFYLADFYRNWRDISDDEVVRLLKLWQQRQDL
jgi:putative phosphoribosyl transferase